MVRSAYPVLQRGNRRRDGQEDELEGMASSGRSSMIRQSRCFMSTEKPCAIMPAHAGHDQYDGQLRQ
jgi:hypothetical protein